MLLLVFETDEVTLEIPGRREEIGPGGAQEMEN